LGGFDRNSPRRSTIVDFVGSVVVIAAHWRQYKGDFAALTPLRGRVQGKGNLRFGLMDMHGLKCWTR
jgi:hypothetical protein